MTGMIKKAHAGVVAVERKSEAWWLITSKPIPLATAEVRQAGPYEWKVRIISDLVPGPVRTLGSRVEAVISASAMVTKRANALWREGGPFNHQQRYAMGQQACPYWMKAHVCGQAPEPGTVWCDWHPKGKRKEVTGS